jgi:nucleoside-diphosphate-sugar epimerase
MRVFVTGASGFIGRNLVPRLLAAGYAVTALLLPDEPEPDLGDVASVRGDITHADGVALTGGVAQSDGVANKMDGCDAVVHLAAAVGYGQSMERCRRINRDGTGHVAAEAVRAGARRFVQLSSVSVYGRARGEPISENSPLRMIGDPYGDTKIEAELLLRERALRGELALTVLRPTVLYGPGDDKFLPKLAENLKSGRARVIGRGDHRVDALHVDDAVDVILRVLADERSVGRTYNLNHPANPTWKEFVAIVAEALGVPPPRRHLPYPLALAAAGALELAARLRGGEPRLTRYAVRVVGRPTDYRVDRARRELGFAPRVELGDGVRRHFSTGARLAPTGSGSVDSSTQTERGSPWATGTTTG